MGNDTRNPPSAGMRSITVSCLALIVALWATGIATATLIRHLIQTAPP